MIFKTFFSVVPTRQKSAVIAKLEQYWIADLSLYLFGGFGSLIRKDSAKFEKKFLKIFEIDRCHESKYCYLQPHWN